MKKAKNWTEEWDNLIPGKSMELFIQEIQVDVLESAVECCKNIHQTNIADVIIQSKIIKLIKQVNGTN